MNNAPVYAVEVTRLQRAVGQACNFLADLGESPELHEQARQASSRVSRLTAFGAADQVVDEAVCALRDQASKLEWRIQAIRISAIARANAICAALVTVEASRLSRANGRGSAGQCPAFTSAKTPAAQEQVSRVAAGSAAAAVLSTAPTQGLERTAASEGVGL